MNKALKYIVTLAIFLPGITQATSYTVSTTTDEIDGAPVCVTGVSADCSLREAIAKANADSSGDHTIYLPANTYTLSLSTVMLEISTDNDNNNDGDLDITNTTNKITIVGEGGDATIISGDGSTMKERVIEVISSASLELQNLRITDGNAAASGSLNGGGIYAAGDVVLDTVKVVSNNNDGGLGAGIFVIGNGTLDMIDSIVLSNSSDKHGGGIYNAMATVTITDSEILNNSAYSTSVFTGGGGVYNDEGTMTITSSQLTGNQAYSSASNSYGAGVYTYLDNSTTVIINSTIGNNTASASSDSFGGGSYVDTGTSTVTLKNVTVAQNTAEFGGGLYGAHTLKHNLIANNTATGTDADCYDAQTSSDGYNFVETDSANCTGVSDDATNTTGTDPGLDSSLTSATGPDYYAFTSASASRTAGAVNSIPAANCVTVLGASPTDILGNARTGWCDVGAYEYQDSTAPVISVAGDNPYSLECTGSYTDSGATATDDIDGSLTVTSDTTSVNEDVVGSYSVSYSAVDRSTNTDSDTRTVNVSDTTDPTITLTGEAVMTIEAGSTYADAGASASDACDTSVSVTTSGTINTSTLGAQTLTYSATDDSSNPALNITRTVTVQDTTVPVITLMGEAAISIEQGATYTDAGATAVDSFEGDLTSSIETVNPVDTDTVGEYSVTYNVSDSSSNPGIQVTRTVTVTATTAEDTGDNTDDEGNIDEEGDGSEDTAATLGTVTKITALANNRVKVTYSGGSTKTFKVFPKGSTKPKAKLATDNERIVVLKKNGTMIRVVDAFTGEIYSKKKANKKAQSKTKLQTTKLYSKKSYDTVIVLTAEKKTGKVIVYRLNSKDQLTKVKKKTVTIANRKQLKLTLKKKKKSFITTFGKGKLKQKHRWKLTGNGKLKKS